jgi:hypothetical protein
LTLTAQDVLSRRQQGQRWIVALTLPWEESATSGSKTIYLSDHSHFIATFNSYAKAAVLSWKPIEIGRARHHESRYFTSDLSVEIGVRHVADQDPTDNILDLLNGFELYGATVTLYLMLSELPESQTLTIYKGTVDGVQNITPMAISLRCRSDEATRYKPSVGVYDGNYPDSRETDRGKRAPILAGRIGFDWARWLLNKDYDQITINGASNPEWETGGLNYFCKLDGAAPCRVIQLRDEETPPDAKVLVSSLPIAKTLLPYHAVQRTGYTPSPTLRPGSLGILLRDAPDSPCYVWDVATGDIDDDAATIRVPTISSGDYGSGTGDRDYEFAIVRYHVPGAADDYAMPDSQNALNRDFETYAHHPAADVSGWIESRGVFLNHPADPTPFLYTMYMMALVEIDVNQGAGFGFNWEIGYNSTTNTTGTHYSLSAGIHLLMNEMNATPKAFIKAQDGAAWGGSGSFWGTASDEYLKLNKVSTAPGFNVKVWSMGITTVHIIPGDMVLANTRGEAGHLSHPVKVTDTGELLFTGYGLKDGSDDEITGPGEILRYLLIEATASNENFNIVVGDINTSSSARGGTGKLDVDIGANVDTLTSSAVSDFILSLAETRDFDVRAIIAEFMESTFTQVYKSTITGKYNVVLKESGVTAGDAVLTSGDIAIDARGMPRFSAPPQDLKEVYNAVYVNFWPEKANGRLTKTVYVDNETVGSRAWDGSTDATREATAELSQKRFGRRRLEVNAYYLTDPASAWETCVRRFDFLSQKRQLLKFHAALGWGLLREPGEIFTTDASINNVMKFPGYVTGGVQGGGSWTNKTWWIRTLRPTPHGTVEIEAIEND